MTMYPELEAGNEELTDQINHVQIGTIRSVNTGDMLAEVEWLGQKGGKTSVALAQPMAGPGYGIYCMPRKGTCVAVGMRTMQIPIILAYLPTNVFYPHSYFTQMSEEFAMGPKDGGMSEGDIYMRALTNVARCRPCGAIHTLSEWEGSIDPDTLIERCPDCLSPAAGIDATTGQVNQVNKVHFGTTLHLKSDGSAEFELNNQSQDGDENGQLKITIKPDSSVQIRDAKNLSIGAIGDITFDCQNLIIKARDSISHVSPNKSSQTNRADVETSASKTIRVDEKLDLGGDITTLAGDTLLSMTAKIRQAKTEEDDIEEVGSKILTASKTIKVLSTEDMNIESGKAMVLKAVNDMAIDATNIILQGGDKSVARVDDTTLADGGTDSAFFTFLSSLVTVINTHFTATFNLHTHAGVLTGVGISGPPTPTEAGTAPSPPTKLDGKITSGNDKVKA